MSIHRPIGATHYALVFGLKGILPIEANLPSLRVSLKGLILDEEYCVSTLKELELLGEKHQKAFNHLKFYQQRMSRSYNQRVKPHVFQVSDLVLRENPRNQHDKGKGNLNEVGLFPMSLWLLMDQGLINCPHQKVNC